jgi:hypothetical protein
MKSRIPYPVGLSLGLSVPALVAGAQTASGNASQTALAAGKITAAGATMNAGRGKPATAPAGAAQAQHANAHRCETRG